MSEDYIGGICYADFDGYLIVLTTEDGISVQNRIVLEPSLYQSPLRYVEHR